MDMDQILVLISGVGLIAFIYWFFFGKKEYHYLGNKVEIIVSGGYKPSVIKAKNNQKLMLSFIRTENNSCLEEIMLPDFKIKKYLPLNEKVDIEIFPEKRGEYEFHCGMNMYRGKIKIL